MKPWRKNSKAWAPPFGVKRPKLNRPLVPAVFAFAGGIAAGHILPAPHRISLLLPLLAACTLLLAARLLSPSFRPWALLSAFFFLGVLGDGGAHTESRLQPLAEAHRQVTIEGTLLEPARIAGETARLKVRGTSIFSEGTETPIDDILSVVVYNHAPSLRPGQKIRFPARLRPFKNFNNPGRYDYESAMTAAGYACAASVSDGRRVAPMGAGDLPFPLGLLEKIRGPIRRYFAERLSPSDRPLLNALILGERQGLDARMREPFNATGLGHVLAVSGLHIGLIAAVSFFFFKGALGTIHRLALGGGLRKTAAFFACAPVVLYAGLAGLQVSSQRAMIMALVFLASVMLGREREAWSSLAAAGLMILVWDPHALYSVSFQLSFMAVIGILWWTPLILNRIPGIPKASEGRGYAGRLRRYAAGLFAVSLAATLFLLPMTSLYFHRVSLVSVPANLTATPLLGLWVLPLGLLSVLALPLSHPLADLLLQGSEQGLHLMMATIRFWSRLPHASLWVVAPNLFELVLLYAVPFFLLALRRKTWAKIGLVVSLAAAVGDAGYWAYRTHFSRDLRITYLDVGHGNAALVEFPYGKRMLIDGGGFASDHFDIGEMVAAPFLWRSKVAAVDYVVLTHPHADHMNGLRFIARWFAPQEFWWNGDVPEAASFGELMSILEKKGIRKRLPADLERGREINGVKVEVFHPGGEGRRPGRWDSRSALNNNSLVLRLSYQGRSFLFPGDIEQEGEKALIARAAPASLKSDVLLAPHHGRESSSSLEFLERVSPRFCIISSGENAADPPFPQTLSRLRAVGSEAVRIDRKGAVTCTVSSRRLTLETFLKE